MPCSTHRSSAFGVEDVGRIKDRRRIAPGDIAGGKCAADFAAADRIHQGPVAAKQIEHRQVGARLLGIADMVEGGQIGQPSQHHGRIVDESRRAELLGHVGDGDAGNFGSHGGR